MRRLILLCGLLLAGCDGASAPTTVNKEVTVNPLSEIKTRLAFTCKYETLPELTADPDRLFKYARWLQVNNQLKRDKAVDAESARLYRIAAENGHVKAAINLQNGALRGQYHLSSAERLRLSERLIDEGVATGYYFIALYLQHGGAGLKQDPEMALRYFRKAADEGNAQAQAYVGDKLAPGNMAPEVARQMRRCAAEQGEGDAASKLGVNLAGHERYQEAMEAFQLGVAAGDSSSASFLEHGFDGPEPDNQLYYLGQQKDPERARRYEQIGDVLGNYSYAHPTVPEINEIVPLPPAELPEWDGKLKWLEAREANIAPPEPDAALIAQLAREKKLNPATGRPLPESPWFEKDTVAQLRCHSGEPCPKGGYWQLRYLPYRGTGSYGQTVHFFREGDIMPTDTVTHYRHRPWPLDVKIITEEQRVEWRFVGEA
ncbi:SEL1-like repeat protein [Pantoea sp. FN060301]|uniref:SEL1-like repeat protein n=1 Tax=Pantoea sp. FN060301 TaxID=3420380 RepID=UPI003D16CC40